MKNRKPENGDELPIRNSTAEFLVFAKDNAADTIAVRFQDRMLWLTLQLIADLFDMSKSTVSEHLTHIYAAGTRCVGNCSEIPNSSPGGAPPGRKTA